MSISLKNWYHSVSRNYHKLGILEDKLLFIFGILNSVHMKRAFNLLLECPFNSQQKMCLRYRRKMLDEW